jgi:hypothetical protein
MSAAHVVTTAEQLASPYDRELPVRQRATLY